MACAIWIGEYIGRRRGLGRDVWRLLTEGDGVAGNIDLRFILHLFINWTTSGYGDFLTLGDLPSLTTSIQTVFVFTEPRQAL